MIVTATACATTNEMAMPERPIDAGRSDDGDSALTTSPGFSNTGDLTEVDVQAARFHDTRGLKAGYNQDEVDDFLDQVADQFASLHARIVELEVQNAELRHANVESASAITEAARKTAADTRAQALRYSSRVMNEAQASASRLLADADKETAGAADVHLALEQHIAYLEQLRDTTQAEVRDYLSGRLAALDRIGEDSDVPP